MYNKLGLFGGTFDPIHLGHLRIADAFLAELQLQQIVFIPSGQPYHKTYPTLTHSADRLAMCQLAIKDQSSYSVNDMDIKRAGNTYTYDTIQQCKILYPQYELWWLLGSDSLTSLNKWHRYQQLIEDINIAIALRDPLHLKELPDDLKLLLEKHLTVPEYQKSGKMHILNIEPLAISSTEIRQAINHNQDVGKWLNPDVYSYIKQYKLYR